MSPQKQPTMSPLDVVILIKMLVSAEETLSQSFLARELFISQSEVSKSLHRSRYAGLVVGSYQVMAHALVDFIQYGIKYAFPQQPGAVVRGIPTAHSMSPLSEFIESGDGFVWPHGRGHSRGHSILPLYPSVVHAARVDPALHEALAMVDVIRVGKARERQLAIQILRSKLLNEEYTDQPHSNVASSPGTG
jgi:hypothetical protein